MKTMIPLRLFGILTNLVLIVTAIPTHNFLVIPVQAAMLVLNSYRLHQMLQLVKDVKRSVSGDLAGDHRRSCETPSTVCCRSPTSQRHRADPGARNRSNIGDLKGKKIP